MAKKILVAEDASDARFFLGQIIRNLGYDVVEAGTGTEAVAKAIAEEPGLIFYNASSIGSKKIGLLFSGMNRLPGCWARHDII
jgi:DNA-binding NtrC family response regulator